VKILTCTLLSAFVFGFLPAFAQPATLADLQARADKGDPQAELDLGRDYHLGTGVAVDYAKAADLYRKSAAQGNAKAMYNLGFMYHKAQGMPQDDATALQWMQKSAEAGLPAAELWVGLAYYNGDSGTKQDYAAAAKWLKLAAAQTGSPASSGPAANVLGVMYANGYGVPKDESQALAWFMKSADEGNGKAQNTLGSLYLKGEGGVKRDLAQAYMWYRLACFRGEQLARHTMMDLDQAKAFTPEQKAEGERLAQEFQIKHHRKPDQGPTPVATEPAPLTLQASAAPNASPVPANAANPAAPGAANSDAPAANSSAVK